MPERCCVQPGNHFDAYDVGCCGGNVGVGMDEQVERALPPHGEVRGSGHDAPSAETSTDPLSRVSTPTYLRFFVPGQAVPKGSRSMFHGRSVESSKKWPAWKQTVGEYALAARVKAKQPILTGPITLIVTFNLHRPQRPKHQHHITKPDLDKLVRGICDALTGVVWVDDSQVEYLVASKGYADPIPEVFIQVAETTD